MIVSFLLQGCIHNLAYKQRRLLYFYHHVQPQDTLYKIGKKYHIPWPVVGNINRISNPHALKIGQRLKIPATIFALRDKVLARQSKLMIEDVSGRGGNRMGYLWPVRGKVSSLFGMRNGRPHQGIDISAPKGRAIIAFKEGVVEFVGWKQGYGRTVVIKHQHVKTLYAHLSAFQVRRKQFVNKGQTIQSYCFCFQSFCWLIS